MKSSFPEATVITPEELYVDLSAHFEREINCPEEDVNGRVHCMLFPEAFFVSGQVIHISGAQL
jgi:hypothetical protein